MAGYLIQVSRVCLRPDNINNFMERSIRVLLSISSSDVTKNAVIRNFGKIHLWEVVLSTQPRLQVNISDLSLVKALWLHISSFLLGLLFFEILLC